MSGMAAVRADEAERSSNIERDIEVAGEAVEMRRKPVQVAMLGVGELRLDPEKHRVEHG
jgi:hypothetical protein